jgi:hypothetical protein
VTDAMFKNCIVCLALLGFGFSVNNSTPRTIVVDVQSVPLAWGDSHLNEKIETTFSRNPEWRLRYAEPSPHGAPVTPPNRMDLDSLIDWGTEVGGRYLLTVTVSDESLEHQKSFNLPLIFHKWETVAVIRGEYRFLDLEHHRLLAAEPFDEKLVGTRQFQLSSDDNRTDPSLHMTADEKNALFSRLEDNLVDRIYNKVAKLARGR